MPELSPDEMLQMQRSLRRRFRIGKDKNLIDVGFGTATRRGNRDSKRGWSVCFFVKRKLEEVPDEKLLPEEVVLTLRQQGKVREVVLPTDVVELGDFSPSGSKIEFRSKKATTGTVVAWKVKGERLLTWGVMTVGHLLPVRLRAGRTHIGLIQGREYEFGGVLLAKSTRESQLDMALFKVPRQDLIDNRMMTASEARSRKRARSLYKLARDSGKRGETLSRFGTRAIQVEYYFPLKRVDDLGQLKDILIADSWANQTFRKGTSGTAWTVASQSAAIQIAGEQSDFSPFKRGMGQALTTGLAWAEKELDTRFDIAAGSFRLIAVF